MTVREIEYEARRYNRLCGRYSGRECYPSLDARRKSLLSVIETYRRLTRWEFICLYGYAAWLSHVAERGLPENTECA